MSEMPGDPRNLEFDAMAMSARLEDLIDQLCHLDYEVREVSATQDPEQMLAIQASVSQLIFNLPLVAIPTVIMFIVSQLNMARHQTVEAIDGHAAAADTITDIVAVLAAADIDGEQMMRLLDVVKVLRESVEQSPYGPCDHEGH